MLTKRFVYSQRGRLAVIAQAAAALMCRRLKLTFTLRYGDTNHTVYRDFKGAKFEGNEGTERKG